MMEGKRGVTPVIATVLLISIVIVLASIVFLWAQGFVNEGTEKFGEPIERACDSVSFEAQVYLEDSGDYTLEVNNRANVPLYGFNIKLIGEGDIRVHKTLPQTINVGDSVKITLLSSDLNDAEDLLIVPVLLGEDGERSETFPCPDSAGEGVTIA